MTSTFKTILFDLDGTIIDTEPTAAQAVIRSFSAWGIHLAETDATYVTGRTWASAFEYLFKKYKLPVTEGQAAKVIMDRYREGLENELVVVPGSVAAVEALATRFPLALVSGSGRADILWALEKLKIKDRFRVILGAEDYPRSKPEPDGYLKALKILSGLPQSSLVFEDSFAGIASARAAGLWVVAITGTNHFKQDTSSAHHQIPDLRSVTTQWVDDLAKKLCISRKPV